MVKPHGVRGELGVRSMTEHPELRFAPGAKLLLGADESSLQHVAVVSARPHRQGYLVALDCVTDRDRAEQIRGWGLYISSGDAARPEDENSYYHHQLIGMAVRDVNLGELGTVAALAETPVHDLLEIKAPGRSSFYLPLIDEFVRSVDTEAGEIVTQVPPGLPGTPGETQDDVED